MYILKNTLSPPVPQHNNFILLTSLDQSITTILIKSLYQDWSTDNISTYNLFSEAFHHQHLTDSIISSRPSAQHSSTISVPLRHFHYQRSTSTHPPIPFHQQYSTNTFSQTSLRQHRSTNTFPSMPFHQWCSTNTFPPTQQQREILSKFRWRRWGSSLPGLRALEPRSAFHQHQ